MLNCLAQVVYLIAVCTVISSPLASTIFAQTDGASEQDIRAAQEIEACSKNLRQIYDAIRAYQRDHNDIPNWLSDLVPRYISDASVLECPICRRTGNKESPFFSDPKLPTCYLYEFAPGPINSQVPGLATHTRREWKLRQMTLVGTMIPIVRCRQHPSALNLAYDGRIYQSPGMWESLLTNHINLVDLSPEHIFGLSTSSSTPSTATASEYMPRDPSARPGLIDLTGFYNAQLSDAWHGPAGNNLAELPTGLQYLSGVDWDIRGIVQLVGRVPQTKKYPQHIRGIKIGQKCQHLYFLHSACFGGLKDEGSEVGAFVVHYATNKLQLEIPIRYGTDVRDWHSWPNEPVAPKELVEAWTGQNALSRADRRYIRLFKTTWTNPFPEYRIENLDYVSHVTNAAPFLIAITAE